ncbi:hypothetical protein LINGRAHAP2_LOCUS22119 [Linum grandiflorum]
MGFPGMSNQQQGLLSPAQSNLLRATSRL